MIFLSQPTTGAEVGRAELMLADHDVDSPLARQRNVAPPAKIAVFEKDVNAAPKVQRAAG